jgi:transposase
MIAVNRLSRCPRTRDYVQKRSSDGKADLDLLRRLKRYIAREVYELLLITFEQEERVLEAA